MQVVAVTDPLELGFARQAMVGVRVNGPHGAGRRRARRPRRGRLRRDHRRLLRPPRRGRLRERRAPARGDLGQDPRGSPAWSAPRRSCTSSCASRPTRGVCAEPVAPCPHYARSRCWHETADDDWTPRPAAARRPRRRRRDRRRRLHRALDRLLPGARPTRRCGSPCSRPRPPASAPRGRNGGWCSALFPASLDVAGRALARAATAPWPSTRRCGDTVDEVLRVAAAEGIDAHVAKGGTIIAGPQPRRSGRGPRPRCATPAPGAAARTTLRLLDAAEATAVLRRHPTCAARRTPRTAPPSTRRGWCAAWPTPSSDAASRSTSRRRVTRDRAAAA